MKIGIVGLGLAGLSIAKALAEAGHAVTGFEQFALIHDKGSSHGDTRMYRRVPFEGAAYVELAEIAYPLWQDWNRASGETLFYQCGGLDAGAPDSHEVKSTLSLSERFGLPYELLDKSELGRRFPLFNVPDNWVAVYQPLCGYICPDAAKVYMHEAAVAAGAVFNFGMKIDNVDFYPETAVTADGEKYGFDYVFITAGGWLPKIIPALSPLLKVERQALGWYKPKRGYEHLIAKMPIASLGDLFYGMPTPRGFFKIGMMHHLHERTDADDVHPIDRKDRDFLDNACRQFLNHVEMEASAYQPCLFTNTPGHNFKIDRHPDSDRIIIFSCCSGHGAKYAPAYGLIALDMLKGSKIVSFDIFKINRTNKKHM